VYLAIECGQVDLHFELELFVARATLLATFLVPARLDRRLLVISLPTSFLNEANSDLSPLLLLLV